MDIDHSAGQSRFASNARHVRLGAWADSRTPRLRCTNIARVPSRADGAAGADPPLRWRYDAPMLPEDFQWIRHGDTLWLYLHDRQLALCVDLPNGRVRVDFVLHRRSEFFDSEAQAVRYVEAWAQKWESRIRERAGRAEVRGW